MNNSYNNIITNLMAAHNFTTDSLQKNMCTREDYQELLDVVLEVLRENKDASIDEIRQKLYEKSGLEDIIKKFFLEYKKAPGAVIEFGTKKHQEKIVVGNSQEVVKSGDIFVPSEKLMQENSIFDLASVTKLFTSVAILQLAGEQKLRLDDPIRKYLPQFKNLGYHNIFNLLTYEPYVTDERIDSAKDVNDAERILFNARPMDGNLLYGRDRYNDISPMILKYIVEKVSGLSFDEYVRINILEKAGMKDTFVSIPSEKIDQVVNSNYNYLLLGNGSLECRDSFTPGISTDSKAVILGQPQGILSGHAGLFSSSEDMTRFLQGLSNGDVLHPALTYEMSKNRTNNYPVHYGGNISYSQSYGFLCNSKNHNPMFSEVYSLLSGVSLAQPGWTGSYVAVDPMNGISLSLLSNRTHNRAVSINCKQNGRVYTDGNGVSFIIDNRGNKIIDSSLFSFDRRKITDICHRLAIQEKMLEDIIGKDLDCEISDVKVRKLTK